MPARRVGGQTALFEELRFQGVRLGHQLSANKACTGQGPRDPTGGRPRSQFLPENCHAGRASESGRIPQTGWLLPPAPCRL
eukprot:4104440-Pyramimonas_sp.AAC.1